MHSDRKLLLSAISGATSTNAVQIPSHNWTLISPGGVDNTAAALSAVPYRIEVNNSNSLDPNKAHSFVSPTMQGIQSVTDRIGAFDQRSASADDFESNWVNLGDLAASAHNGVGQYRWIRIVNDGGFTGSLSAYQGHLWGTGLTPGGI
jgi:hypothetical protein